MATYSLPTTAAVGSHDYTARFLPNTTTVTGSLTPAPVRVEVTTIGSTTALIATGDGQVFGTPQPIALTAKVALADHSPAAGTVVFTIDGAVRARIALADDVATYTLPSTEEVGTKQVTAQFVPAAGDTVSGSSAPVRTIDVLPAGSATRLTLSGPAQTYGTTRPVTATARVDLSPGGRLEGSVQFRIGIRLAASVKIDAEGEARYTLSPTELPGRKAVTATFLPTSAADVRGSASSAATVTVKPASSTTTLTASKKSQSIGDPHPVRITATIRLDDGRPAGKVVFRLDGKVVKTIAVTNGKATYTLAGRLPAGRHAATAEFVPTSPTGVRRSSSGSVGITVRRR